MGGRDAPLNSWEVLQMESRLHTVLVVDDEHGLVALLCDVLESEGYRVYTAQDGQAALSLSFDVRPDLILSDVMMPRMDGHTLLSQLRAHTPTADIPVVLMTAGTPPRVEDERTAVIAKPFDVDELLDRIDHYLG